MENLYTVLVGGKAGEGVKKAAQVVAAIMQHYKRHTFQMDDYQSLIKGGHNFSVVSSNVAEVFNSYDRADLIICFDQRSIDEHQDKLRPQGLLFFNGDVSQSDSGIGIPFTSLAKKHLGPKSNISVAVPAIFCALIRSGEELLDKIITKYYKKSLEGSIAFAREVYELVLYQSMQVTLINGKTISKQFSGNQLVSLGAWTAGLDVYYSYPMTPASSILHYLASKQNELGVYAIHTESELAAINMAIGSVFAGAKAAVGSSAGGFALMQEGFSLAGMAEVPLLTILSSRPGPATGVSTYTAQEDLVFALGQGHGEFCRIVASPDSHERAFSLAAELLSLAWELQIPTILLTEKHLSESIKTTTIVPDDAPFTAVKEGEENIEYERYRHSPDGVSPLIFPPTDSVIKWNSHEHLESGLRTDKADAMVSMKDKRFLKYQSCKKAVAKYAQVAQYGEGVKVVFAYGSTVMELREAAKHVKEAIRIVAPIYLEPFPLDELKEFVGCEAVVVEHNQSASLAELLKIKLGISVKASILKYDGRAFDPEDLARRLMEVYDA